MSDSNFAVGLTIGLAVGVAAGVFVAQDGSGHRLPKLPPGSHAVLNADLQSAPGVSVVISDVVIPAGQGVPKHTHPGEEFVYLIEGDAVHVEDGAGDYEMRAGDALVIGAGKAHAPHGGKNGARAVVFRVHPTGEPERTLVE